MIASCAFASLFRARNPTGMCSWGLWSTMQGKFYPMIRSPYHGAVKSFAALEALNRSVDCVRLRWFGKKDVFSLAAIKNYYIGNIPPQQHGTEFTHYHSTRQPKRQRSVMRCHAVINFTCQMRMVLLLSAIHRKKIITSTIGTVTVLMHWPYLRPRQPSRPLDISGEQRDSRRLSRSNQPGQNSYRDGLLTLYRSEHIGILFEIMCATAAKPRCSLPRLSAFSADSVAYFAKNRSTGSPNCDLAQSNPLKESLTIL